MSSPTQKMVQDFFTSTADSIRQANEQSAALSAEMLAQLKNPVAPLPQITTRNISDEMTVLRAMRKDAAFSASVAQQAKAILSAPPSA